MTKPRATHTSFYKGSKIRLVFRDGKVLVGKFVEKRSDRFMDVQHPDGTMIRIAIADLSSCNYYKPLPHEIAPKKE